MTVSSKPQDNDAIIKRVKSALGGEEYVATDALITFFDDLVNLLNSVSNTSDTVAATSDRLQAMNASKINEIRRRIDSLYIPQPASRAAIKRELESLESSLSQQISALLSVIGRISAAQKAQSQKLNDMEHLCLSNLVR